MKESILHYIWQNKLFTAHNLVTTNNEAVEVIDTGLLNSDAGPDFFNAKVRIGNTIWAGNIEIHTKSSDWKKHHHQSDPVYNPVILHVVKTADTNIYRTNGEIIPQLELRYPFQIEENYERLIAQQKWIACEDKIADLPPIILSMWKNALLAERLALKTEAIKVLLNESNQHWEEAFYRSLARSFGFGTNSLPFETLAKSLSLSVLAKHKDNLFQLEALLFGQSGLLSVNSDEYAGKLWNEYLFLQAKYKLVPMDGSMWKLMRLRPDNFPHLRIAQFAGLIHSLSKLFSKIIENPDISVLNQLFVSTPSSYWDHHYLFGNISSYKKKTIGRNSLNSIIINSIVPFVFVYGWIKNDEQLKSKAMDLLTEIPAEKNVIVKKWQEIGFNSGSAFDSQALLFLKKHYCDEKKCLRCRIGHNVLTLQPK